MTLAHPQVRNMETRESVLQHKAPGAFAEGPTDKERVTATSPTAYSTQHSGLNDSPSTTGESTEGVRY